MQNHITLDFADGAYDFRLTWPGCAEIERKSNAGIQAIYERVMLGQAHLADVAEIIRQGLLGGKSGLVDGQAVEVKPALADALLKRYVTGEDAQPFTESWTIARVVLNTFMVGYKPEAGNTDGSKKKPDEAEAAAST